MAIKIIQGYRPRSRRFESFSPYMKNENNILAIGNVYTVEIDNDFRFMVDHYNCLPRGGIFTLEITDRNVERHKITYNVKIIPIGEALTFIEANSVLGERRLVSYLETTSKDYRRELTLNKINE